MEHVPVGVQLMNDQLSVSVDIVCTDPNSQQASRTGTDLAEVQANCFRLDFSHLCTKYREMQMKSVLNISSAQILLIYQGMAKRKNTKFLKQNAGTTIKR